MTAAPSRACLQCGERPRARGSSRCDIEMLDQHSRALSTIADRLDRAGFWAAARSVWQAAEAADDLVNAISKDASA